MSSTPMQSVHVSLPCMAAPSVRHRRSGSLVEGFRNEGPDFPSRRRKGWRFKFFYYTLQIGRHHPLARRCALGQHVRSRLTCRLLAQARGSRRPGTYAAIACAAAARRRSIIAAIYGLVPLARSRSGTDTRTGRIGRDKIIWGWCENRALRDARRGCARAAAA